MKKITIANLYILLLISMSTVSAQPFLASYSNTSNWFNFTSDVTCKPCGGNNLLVQMETLNFADFYLSLILTTDGSLVNTYQFPSASSTTNYFIDVNHKINVEPIFNGTLCDGYIVVFTAKVDNSDFFEPQIIRFDENLNVVWHNSPYSNTIEDVVVQDFILETSSGVILAKNGVVAQFDLTTGNISQSEKTTLWTPSQMVTEADTRASSIIKLNNSFSYPGEYAMVGSVHHAISTGLGHSSFITFLSSSLQVTEKYHYDITDPSTTPGIMVIDEGIDLVENNGKLYISGNMFNSFNGNIEGYQPYILEINGETSSGPVGDVLAIKRYNMINSIVGLERLVEMELSPSGNGMLLAGDDGGNGVHFLTEVNFNGTVNWSKRYEPASNVVLHGLKVSSTNICICGSFGDLLNVRTNLAGEVGLNCNDDAQGVGASIINATKLSLNHQNSPFLFSNVSNTINKSVSNFIQIVCSGPTTNVDEESALANEVYISPNPSTDWINLRNETSFKIDKITLLSMTGQMLIHKENPTDQLNIAKLEGGCYIVKLSMNGQSIIKKIIKI